MMARSFPPRISRDAHGDDPLSLHEDAFGRLVELVNGDFDKVPRPRLLETPIEVSIEDDEWDDFEQVYTKIYLSLRGLPQSRIIP